MYPKNYRTGDEDDDCTVGPPGRRQDFSPAREQTLAERHAEDNSLVECLCGALVRFGEVRDTGWCLKCPRNYAGGQNV